MQNKRSPLVLKHDQERATVEASKVKKEEESLQVAGCSKKIWLKWLQVTGEMSSSFPYIEGGSVTFKD